MRHDHIHSRGWSDIGQNLTIFPDGRIGLCRAIDITPAGIYGANTGAICIEHLGNFDEGKDAMTQEQKDSIIKANALLCMKFGLKPVTTQVVYHHWYDTTGKRFSEADIDGGKVLRNKLQKTCPGTGFFTEAGFATKGNTIASAKAHFYPLIEAEMQALQQAPAVVTTAIKKTVHASKLNVRKGRGVQYDIVGKLYDGMQVSVYDEVDGWSRINNGAEEWVSSQYLN
jgi:hypothetical protein